MSKRSGWKEPIFERLEYKRLPYPCQRNHLSGDLDEK